MNLMNIYIFCGGWGGGFDYYHKKREGGNGGRWNFFLKTFSLNFGFGMQKTGTGTSTLVFLKGGGFLLLCGLLVCSLDYSRKLWEKNL